MDGLNPFIFPRSVTTRYYIILVTYLPPISSYVLIFTSFVIWCYSNSNEISIQCILFTNSM